MMQGYLKWSRATCFGCYKLKILCSILEFLPNFKSNWMVTFSSKWWLRCMPFPNIKNTNIKKFVYSLDKSQTAIVPEISVEYTIQSNSVLYWDKLPVRWCHNWLKKRGNRRSLQALIFAWERSNSRNVIVFQGSALCSSVLHVSESKGWDLILHLLFLYLKTIYFQEEAKKSRSSSRGDYFVKPSRLDKQIISFSRNGVKSWNSLPCDICHLSKNNFKIKIRNILLRRLSEKNDCIDLFVLITKIY